MRSSLLVLTVLSVVASLLVACAGDDSATDPTVPSSTTSSTTTAPTTTLATTTTTVPSTDLDGFVLRGGGLGVVSFGDPMEDVIAALSIRLGPPSSEWSEEAPFEEEARYEGDIMPCFFATGGYACFDYLGTAAWEGVGLWLVFADLTVRDGADRADDDYYVRAEPNLRGYSYRPEGTSASLSTVEGLTIGSTVADLLDVYGDAVRFSLGCGEADIEFHVAAEDAAGAGSFGGQLHGEDVQRFAGSGQVNSDATVSSIVAGMAWTPC